MCSLDLKLPSGTMKAHPSVVVTRALLGTLDCPRSSVMHFAPQKVCRSVQTITVPTVPAILQCLKQNVVQYAASR
jgi:hypothetical protein